MDRMTPRIPMLDLKPEIQLHWEEFNAAIQDVLRSGQFILGPQGTEFEKEVARYLGVGHAIGLNSGTDALVIALRALGIGPGDEVVTTPFSFFATAEAVSLVGATPVFADVELESMNLDPGLVEAKLNRRTKAILPVHLFGNPADLTAIQALGDRYGIPVVEDVAQGMGGELAGRKLGTWGKLACFSFFPSKNLGAFGDAGLVVTNDQALAERCRMLRMHGSRRRYFHEEIGYNSRLDEVQAAVLRIKLRHLDQANEERRRVARRYHEVLGNHPAIRLQGETAGGRHVYHQYTIRVLGGMRDKVRAALADKGIATMAYYEHPLHRLPPYAAQNQQLPIAETLAGEAMSLPFWPEIPPDSQLEVARGILDVIGGR